VGLKTVRLLVLSCCYSPDLSAGSFRTVALVKALRERAHSGSAIDVVTTAPNRYASFSREAAHTPRAMALSRREGLHAIAAPTGNLVTPSEPGAIKVPGLSGAALIRSETAIHEYLGLLALRFGIF
jgi:hypothetical protein